MHFADGTVVDDGYFGDLPQHQPVHVPRQPTVQLAPEATLDRGLSMVTVRSLALPVLLGAASSALGFGRDVRRQRRVDLRTDLDKLTVNGYGPFPYQVDGDYLGETEHSSSVTSPRSCDWFSRDDASVTPLQVARSSAARSRACFALRSDRTQLFVSFSTSARRLERS